MDHSRNTVSVHTTLTTDCHILYHKIIQNNGTQTYYERSLLRIAFSTERKTKSIDLMFTTNNCYLQLYYVDLSSLQLKILLIKIHKKNH